MAKLVCGLENRDCMIHRCPDCPGVDALRQLMLEEYKGESNRFVNVELYKYCYGPPLFEGTHIMIKQLM